MSRTPRYIISKMPYEICLRTKRGLPFVYYGLIKLLLDSAIARANREGKVIICHYLWMANHLHLLIITKDPDSCQQFYAELQKKVTDYMKRLLGLDHLDLWESRPMVALVADAEMVKQRIAYFYANPARADLVESIEDYPGLSSWTEFQSSDKINSEYSREVPWIRLPTITPLRTRRLTQTQDNEVVAKLICANKNTEVLSISPNAWMTCFGFNDSEAKTQNIQIVENVRAKEQAAKKRRLSIKKCVKGTSLLKQEPIFRGHIPKKQDRNIFVLSSLPELRIAFINTLCILKAKCRLLYKQRAFHLWPPGMFRPALGALASALPF